MIHAHEFIAKVTANPTARGAYEDATSRNLLIDQLIRRRKELDLTQAEVAKRMGIGQSTVSQMEAEGSNPRLSTVLRYARAVESTLLWKVKS